uniref:Integrin, alpha 9 n=1 Tax=Nothobranchius pienaari TaxID=704102 RepID=A0A1A8MCV1_9TELE
MEEDAILTGDNAFNAHFGECLAAIGDIDDDGYQDVAIGAPKEDDYGGAVYIYHGDATGITRKYSMKLAGRSFLVQAKSANPEHNLSDNSLDLSIPLIHETDATITGVVTPSSFVEIIEAEKNRKDSDESWDWMDKDH